MKNSVINGKYHFLSICCFLILGNMPFYAHSQSPVITVVSDSKASTAYMEYVAGKDVPSFIEFKAKSAVAPQMAFVEIKDELEMGPDDAFNLMRSDADDIGYKHFRYQQMYKGIKVETGEFILHVKNNYTVSANGEFINNINLSPVAIISKGKALKAALSDVNALTYKWQVPSEENWIKQIKNDPAATLYPTGELVIIIPSDSQRIAKNAVLAWKFDIYAHDPHGRFFVYVNAYTGTVIQKADQICEFVAHGTALTKYSGVQPITTDSLAPTSFRLRDFSRGAQVATYDLNNGTNYGNAVDFTDNNNVWDSITNQDNAAYDAHIGGEKTWDYYYYVHGWNSYDNFGSPLISYIHYSSGYNNAFWNGSVMTYGDGNGSTFSPLTTIDICGHELTHGVTDYTSNLIYANESGALNESFSDIFGTCIDFYAFPAAANWKLGEQCYTPGTPGDALRHLDNPNAAADPDTYLGTYWYSGTSDNGGVHTNSGVQNFWFYLLCQGGSGTNDNGFAYNVTGIGINNARLIAYRNNTFYLTSGSGYADARRYAIKAAADIFGPCSFQMVQTANAWDAVGVYGTFSGNPFAEASASGIVCEGAAVNLTSQGGTTFQWSGPAAFSSTQQNPTITNSAFNQAGTYTVTVTDANGCSGTATAVVRLNQSPTIAGTGISLCPGATGTLAAMANANGSGGPPFTTTNPAIIPIPDNNTTGILSPITIATPAAAYEVISVQIDSIDHTYTSDLTISLRAPNNSQITLASGVGGSGNNFDHTIFSSTANNVIGSAGNNTAPFNGTYAPQQSFTLLTGPATGTWNLKVVDPWNLDVGSLRGWRITISSANVLTTYAWSPATGLSSSSIASPTVSLLDSQSYTVIVTDNKGCTKSADIQATVYPLASANVTSTNIICGGTATGTITAVPLTGTAPFYYALDTGSFVASGSFPGQVAGSHLVYVKDVNECNVESYSVVITQNTPLTATSTISPTLCYGAKNGVVNLSPSGGTSPLTYMWSNSKTTEDLSNLLAGTYTCTVTDSNGCTLIHSRLLSQYPQITMTFTKTAATAPLYNDGTATCTPANGFPTYRYSWNTAPAQTTATATGLVPGTYVVTVKDNKKCARNGSVIILAARWGIQPIASHSLTAMPNPGDGFFTINASFTEEQAITAKVSDITGRIINERIVLVKQGTNSFDVDIQEEPPGLYFLEIESVEGRETHKLVIK